MFGGLWVIAAAPSAPELRWIDEFGNPVAGFFTSQATVDRFISAGLPDGWKVESMPLSAATYWIVAHIREKTSLFAIDPESRDRFKALTAEEFLTEIFGIIWEDGIEFSDDV